MGRYRFWRGIWNGAALVALAAGLLLPAGHVEVGAQDGTEEPDAGTEEPPETHIYTQSAWNSFPVAINFTVTLNVPVDEITAATLTVRQASSTKRRIPLDPPGDYLYDGSDVYAVLRYEWLLLNEPVLMPFEPVQYTWQVETDDGLLSTGDQEFVLQDGRNEPWYAAGIAPLTLHWHRGRLDGVQVQQEIFAAYDLLARRTGERPIFDFVIYEAAANLCSTTYDPETDETTSVLVMPDVGAQYPCSLEAYEAYYARAGMTTVQRTSSGFADLEDQLVEAMVRQVYGALWDGQPVPAWLPDGLASLYRLHPGYAALAQARAAADDERLLELPALATAPAPDATAQSRMVWEAESFLLTLYLADQYGAEAPFDLARQIAADEDGFDGALADLTGGDEDALWNAWRAWLTSPEADRAVGWTPYQPTTPTPTITPSPTPVTPTRTPSATPEPSATSTATPPGAPPATAVVLQPTPIRITGPTNTPLPPGSLPTLAATAVVEQPTAQADEDELDPLLLGVVAVGVLIGFLVMVVGVLSLRRRP